MGTCVHVKQHELFLWVSELGDRHFNVWKRKRNNKEIPRVDCFSTRNKNKTISSLNIKKIVKLFQIVPEIDVEKLPSILFNNMFCVFQVNGRSLMVTQDRLYLFYIHKPTFLLPPCVVRNMFDQLFTSYWPLVKRLFSCQYWCH